MTQRISEALAVVFLAVAIALAGCATTPGAGQGAGSGGEVMRAAGPGGAGQGGGPRPSPRDFVVTADLPDIHFDFDKYEIRPDDARLLESSAQWLKANPAVQVLIEGHADERGTNEYNLALGDRRARASMNYLVSYGVSSRRITVISYGEERPLCHEKTELCWAENRRAHFAVKLH